MKNNIKVIRINLMSFIISVIIILIIGVGVLNIIKNTNKENVKISEYSTEHVEINTISQVFYPNGWVKDYISEIKYDVPIPNGYEYVQGEKDTGLIIKDENNDYYMWIPYNKDAKIDNIDEYFKSVSGEGKSDFGVINSIVKYNGFFISLLNNRVDYEQFKKIDDKTLDKLNKQIKESTFKNDSININIIGRNELEQILYFVKDNNINITNIRDINSEEYKITKISNDAINNTEKETWYTGLKIVSIKDEIIIDENNGYGYTKWEYSDEKNPDEKHYLYVPDGFSLSPTFGYSYPEGGAYTIKSNVNPNLSYVWVSVEEYMDENSTESAAQQVRNELLKIFDDYNIKTGADVKYPISDVPTLNADLEYSIKKFKGFYIAESTTKIDNDGNVCTHKTGTKDFKPDMNGDYIRRKAEQDIESWIVYINDIASSTLSDNDNIISCVAPTTGFEALFVNEGKNNPEKIIENNYAEGAGSMDSSPQNVDITDVPTIQRGCRYARKS